MLIVTYAECHILALMLSVIMPNVVMLNVIMLNVVMLSVVLLSVIMLSVVAPISEQKVSDVAGILVKKM